MRQLAADNENIIFAGEQTNGNLRALFENAYLFVQPSETEGLSIALLEAMAYGLPVITSDIEENLEATSGLGRQFANKDSKDLAKQLELALGNPSEIKNEAFLAKQIIGREYNWDNITIQTIGLYKEPVQSELLAKLVK